MQSEHKRRGLKRRKEKKGKAAFKAERGRKPHIAASKAAYRTLVYGKLGLLHRSRSRREKKGHG